MVGDTVPGFRFIIELLPSRCLKAAAGASHQVSVSVVHPHGTIACRAAGFEGVGGWVVRVRVRALSLTLPPGHTVRLTSPVALVAVPAIDVNTRPRQALCTSPPMRADVSFSQPSLLGPIPLLSVLVLCSLGLAKVLLVIVSEVVSVVVLPCERIGCSITLWIITFEALLLICGCMNVPIVTFKVGWPVEWLRGLHCLTARKLAGVQTLLGISRQASKLKDPIFQVDKTYVGLSRYTLTGV